MPDWAEEKLTGLDRPRPLDPEVAERLGRALLGAAASEPVALGDSLSSRLEDALSDPLHGVMDDLGAPRPLDATARRRLEAALGARRRPPRLVLAAAAALVVLAGAGAALATLLPTTSPHPEQASGTHAGSQGSSAGRITGAGGVGTPGLAPLGVPQTTGPQNGSSAAGALATASPSAGTGLGPQRAPTVTGLDPDNGPTTGGTWVTVTGTGFDGVTAVRFGTSPATFTVVSGGELRARAPAHGAGTVDVRVTTASGTSTAVAADRYSYR